MINPMAKCCGHAKGSDGVGRGPVVVCKSRVLLGTLVGRAVLI
jgi:hypothetical protein